MQNLKENDNLRINILHKRKEKLQEDLKIQKNKLKLIKDQISEKEKCMTDKQEKIFTLRQRCKIVQMLIMKYKSGNVPEPEPDNEKTQEDIDSIKEKLRISKEKYSEEKNEFELYLKNNHQLIKKLTRELETINGQLNNKTKESRTNYLEINKLKKQIKCIGMGYPNQIINLSNINTKRTKNETNTKEIENEVIDNIIENNKPNNIEAFYKIKSDADVKPISNIKRIEDEFSLEDNYRSKEKQDKIQNISFIENVNKDNNSMEAKKEIKKETEKSPIIIEKDETIRYIYNLT